MEALSQEQLILIGLGVVAFLMTLAAMAVYVRTIHEEIVTFILPPLGSILVAIGNFLTNYQKWIVAKVLHRDEEGQDYTIQRILGSIIYTMITMILLMSDLAIISLTLAAMGFEEGSYKWPLGISPSWIIAVGICACMAFWASVITDIKGLHNLGPWQKIAGAEAKNNWLVWLGSGCLVVGVVIVILLTYWRFDLFDTLQTMENALLNASPDTVMDQAMIGDGALGQEAANTIVDNTGAKWAMILISCLSVITTCFAAICIPTFASSLFLLCLWLLTLPVRLLQFTGWLLYALFNSLFNLTNAVLELLIGLGAALLAPFRFIHEQTMTAYYRHTGQTRPEPKVDEPAQPIQEELAEEPSDDGQPDNTFQDSGFRPM